MAQSEAIGRVEPEKLRQAKLLTAKSGRLGIAHHLSYVDRLCDGPYNVSSPCSIRCHPIAWAVSVSETD